MSKNIFISDISFTKDYFSLIPDKFCFYSPFIDTLEDIYTDVKNGGNVLVGWATGAHLIAKNVNTFKDKWNKIILIAPFLRFTENISEETINILLKGFDKDFQKTISYFQSKAGIIKKVNLDNKYKDKLVNGLNYLKTSVVEASCDKDITIIYGCANQLIKRTSILNFLKLFKNANFMEIDQAHFIPEDIILNLL